MYQPTHASARGGVSPLPVSSADAGSIRSPFWLIRDEPRWESFSERDLPAYLDSSLRIFTQQLTDYLRSSGPASAQKEQRLQIMLESLLHARYVQALAAGEHE